MGLLFYLTERISGGNRVHIGSIFRKVFQAETFLYRRTELQQALPKPQTHILTLVWISNHTWTKPLVSVVQTLERIGEDRRGLLIFTVIYKLKQTIWPSRLPEMWLRQGTAVVHILPFCWGRTCRWTCGLWANSTLHHHVCSLCRKSPHSTKLHNGDTERGNR